MSKILANEIANYGDDAPIEVKEGLNIPAGKPLQAAGASGSNGQVLTSTGSTVEWTTPFNGDYNTLTNRPTIPAAQVQSDWNAVGTVAAILNKPVVPAVPSITVNPPGSANLAYNSGNGEFTYTPPDLSSFATSVDLSTAVANSSNWDTAYGWGDHAAAGYLTAEADTLATVTSRGYTTSNNIVFNDGVQARFGTLNGTGEGDLRIYHAVDGSASVIQEAGGTDLIIMTAGSDIKFRRNNEETFAEFHNDGSVDLYYDNTKKFETTSTGVTITGDLSVSGTTDLDIEDLNNVDITAGLSDQQVLKWDSASSSWKPANDLVGGAQGIQLVDLSVSTAPAGSTALSYNNTNGVFTYTPPDLSGYATTAAVANAANWDTAYGWGDHAAAGYLTAYTETDPVFTASAAAGITLTKINQWDTAYGWGNHANGGYLVATAQDKTNWNTAFGWGDHSTEGYLTSFTETDPVFSASVAAGISGAEVANWNTAYGWGDHSVEGYLTSTGSIDTHTDVTITTPVNGEVLAYNGSQWVNTSSASIANATISDTAPGSPTVGDLWWESDKGRLKIYYNDTDSQQWVDASPPLAQPNVPVAAGCITLNGTSPTWSGTTGYTVSGAQPGGAGTDYVITLTFPTAYSARTDYIVQATYDGTNYVSGNGASIGVARGTASVVFTPRRWDENPLSLGEIMVTITNL